MFKLEVKDEIDKRLQEFAQVEMNNRLTVNSWNWLILTLEAIWKQNELKSKQSTQTNLL